MERPTTRVLLPVAFDPERHDAGHMHEWLANRGHIITGVSVRSDGQVIIEVPEDASKGGIEDDAAAFTAPPTEEEQLEDELDGIDIDTADLEQLRRAVGLMRDLQTKKDAKDARRPVEGIAAQNRSQPQG